MKLNTIVMKVLMPFKPITPQPVRDWIVLRLMERSLGRKLDPEERPVYLAFAQALAKLKDEPPEQRKLVLAILRERLSRIDQAERSKGDDER